MTGKLSSQLKSRLTLLSWPTALIAVVVVRAVASYVLKPGSPLLSYGAISYFLLLFLAAGFALRNAIQSTLGSRPFWILFAFGQVLWLLDQGVFLYHEYVLHTDVPDNSIADPLLFLHIVPFMAAVAILPTGDGSAAKLYRVDFERMSLALVLGFSLSLRGLSLRVLVSQGHYLRVAI